MDEQDRTPFLKPRSAKATQDGKATQPSSTT